MTTLTPEQLSGFLLRACDDLRGNIDAIECAENIFGMFSLEWRSALFGQARGLEAKQKSNGLLTGLGYVN
ncbi:MAG: hypothetical protein IT364_26320 [Candidatus Hydrogenedentes bacterium]|nr:hypothetical protein [Candidatus Hydrogenedentota bacterium]